MAQPDIPSPTPTGSHKLARQSRAQQVVARLWSEWRVEIFIVLLAAFGIFLLVERMQIRQTLLGWLSQGLQALRNLGGGILRGVVDFVQNTTLSDLTGYVLLLIALAFVAWRARWRLTHMPRFTRTKCPRCGTDLHRIHRSRFDLVLDLFVPVRRYRCKNHDCRWQGLRVKRSRYE